MQRFELSGKRVCLTGGTDGIGLDLAHLLIKENAEVLIVGRRRNDEVLLPDGCHYLSANLSEPVSVDAVTRETEKLGWDTVDFLIHNASIGYVGPFDDQESDTMISMVEVNLKAPLGLSQKLFPMLERAGGTVCFITSTASGKAQPDFALYTATKTALSDLADNLRVEWKDRVRVVEVQPGPTRTDFHKKSGLENPPMAWAFMKSEEVARGILDTLQSRKARKRYGLFSMLAHLVARSIKKRAS